MENEELNEWLNLESTQEILSYNQHKLLNMEIQSMEYYIDKKIHG
jgi:hypothetical protein